MNDIDQSSAAALRPHRPDGDTSSRGPAGQTGIWSRLKSLFGPRPASLREDLREALRSTGGEGGAPFSAGERSLIENVLNLGQVRVEDVMVPRADIVAVEAGESVAHLARRFRVADHSRLPVFEDNLDNIIGMVHIKDLLAALAEDRPEGADSVLPVRLRSTLLKSPISRTKLVRKLLYVPPSMPVGDLLHSMQATRIHMAMVVDEYGGTDGLVTIEDLLEAVVGDIEDEHDVADADLVRAVGEGTYIADARVELDELAEAIGDDFDPGRHAEDIDTLGGLLFSLCGRVPVRGEVVSRLRGFEFEIMQADPRRIRTVKITRRRRADRAKPAPLKADAKTPPASGKEAAE
jgi:CBS domain containing-hemolysin-like protein